MKYSILTHFSFITLHVKSTLLIRSAFIQTGQKRASCILDTCVCDLHSCFDAFFTAPLILAIRHKEIKTGGLHIFYGRPNPKVQTHSSDVDISVLCQCKFIVLNPNISIYYSALSSILTVLNPNSQPKTDATSTYDRSVY